MKDSSPKIETVEEAARKCASKVLAIPADEIMPDDTIMYGFYAGAEWQRELKKVEQDLSEKLIFDWFHNEQGEYTVTLNEQPICSLRRQKEAKWLITNLREAFTRRSSTVEGWIACSERLPETHEQHGNYYSSGHLLTWNGDQYGVGEFVKGGQHTSDGFVETSRKWYNSNEDDEVTHWATLPLPPK